MQENLDGGVHVKNKYLVLAATSLLLTACGGRKLDLVQVERNMDDKLTCGHMSAEFQVNTNRIAGLTGERSHETTNNFGMLLVAPLFLDFSGTERKEIEALQQRNLRLIDLMSGKDCADVPNIEKPDMKKEEAKAE